MVNQIEWCLAIITPLEIIGSNKYMNLARLVATVLMDYNVIKIIQVCVEKLLI